MIIIGYPLILSDIHCSSPLSCAAFCIAASFMSLQEEQLKGKPNWEHLSEELHVLVTVEDTQNRAEVKMQRAVDEIKKLLIPAVIIFST